MKQTNNYFNKSQYYDVEKFCKHKFQAKKLFSIFHLNIHSLQFHIEDLKIILELLDFDFDIIAISETKLINGVQPKIDINLSDYNFEDTPTDSSKGGTAIYISKKHSYKPRKDLNIYKSKELESTFIEIISPNQTNTIIGCIYKHPNMSQTEFTDDFMKPLLNKVNTENKKIYLTGDFNMDLLKTSSNVNTSEYFELLSSNNFIPLINGPTRVSPSSKTLIDNIFYNQFTTDVISGNLTVGISDHMPQFSLVPNSNQYHLPKHNNNFRRNLKTFDNENFILDYLAIDWSQLENMDTNAAFESFISIINKLLDQYAPLTKTTNKEHKLKIKPWITKGILKSIKIRDRIFNNFTKAKNNILKTQLHNNYKYYRNSIVNLIKKNKKQFYDKYFAENNKNMRAIWKELTT